MPITLLDIILIGVMLISALLAMIRGFMREVLSIAAWAIAAVVTLYSYTKLLPFAKTYFNNDIIAAAVVVGGTFLGTLLIVSIITVRFSDMVLDSRIGALDRTLGFLFGLARGLVIVVVAFLFFAWLVPDRSQPEWVRPAVGPGRPERSSRLRSERPVRHAAVAPRQGSAAVTEPGIQPGDGQDDRHSKRRRARSWPWSDVSDFGRS